MKAALFDMDGTLIDVLDLWRGLLACYLAPFGASLTEEQFLEAMTLPYDRLAVYLQEVCSLPKTPHEIMEEIDVLSIEEYAQRATLKKGVGACVRSLYEQGLCLFVVTTNLGEIAHKVLKRFSLDQYFSGVYGTHELRHKKIFPECFLDIAERIGFPPEECVVFEDSYKVAKSAKLAGMYVVGVIGEQPDAEKRELIAIADVTVSSDYERMSFDAKN